MMNTVEQRRRKWMTLKYLNEYMEYNILTKGTTLINIKYNYWKYVYR